MKAFIYNRAGELKDEIRKVVKLDETDASYVLTVAESDGLNKIVFSKPEHKLRMLV